jgi:DNA repair protein RAD57
MLSTHSVLVSANPIPSLDRVISIVTPDLESQDHILRFQLPVAIRRHNIGLVVLDSVAANYRAEFERPGAIKNGANMAKRLVNELLSGAHAYTNLMQVLRTGKARTVPP